MLRLCHWGYGFWSRSAIKTLLVTACFFYLQTAHASITVLVGEPFGNFGTMMPVGHTAIYLDHLCAEGPLKLRTCRPGEQEGVVVARYHQLGRYDWLASPVMEFLYATDDPSKVLTYATIDNSWALREIYRQRYLENIVPDGTEYDKVTDEWWESAGTAYTRRIWGYQLATTPEQDRRFMNIMNERANIHAYRLKNNNCADFAAEMVNTYFPGSVHRDHTADFGWMTPKTVARCVEAYGHAHPELALKVFEIPQVPGSLRRSRPARGAAEAGLTTKRYLATLLVIQPEVPVVCAILYLKHGRWQIGHGAQVVGPEAFAHSVGALQPSTIEAANSKPPSSVSTQTPTPTGNLGGGAGFAPNP
jgi:hypothetical protein